MTNRIVLIEEQINTLILMRQQNSSLSSISEYLGLSVNVLKRVLVEMKLYKPLARGPQKTQKRESYVRKVSPKLTTRVCLCCRKEFGSGGIHNRICHACKHSEEHRYGFDEIYIKTE